MALSAARVKALKEPGRYSDGGGLHLYVSKAGRKSWVLRITIDGRRRDIGLGAFPSVSLAKARGKAGDHRLPSLDDSVTDEFLWKPTEGNDLGFDDFGGLKGVVARARELIEVQIQHRGALSKIRTRPIK